MTLTAPVACLSFEVTVVLKLAGLTQLVPNWATTANKLLPLRFE